MKKSSANATSQRPDSIIRFPVGLRSADGPVISCENLCLAPAVDGVRALTPAPPLASLHPAPLRLLASTTLPQGGHASLFTTPSAAPDGRNKLYVDIDGRLSTVTDSSPLPFCAVPHGAGWIVMTAGGRQTITVDSQGTASVSMLSTASPDVALVAESAGTVSTLVPAMTFDNVDLSRDSPSLGDANGRKLSEAMVSAYSSIMTSASEAGAWLQPMVGRVRLLDASGHLLWSSEPVILGGGWQCCGLYSVTASKPSESSLSLPAFSVEAAVYRLRLRICSLGAFADTAATAEIRLTPQVHPVSPSLQAPYRITHPAQQQPVVTLAIPGATASMADDSASRALIMRRLADRIDSATCTASIAATSVNSTISCTERQSLAAARSALDSFLSKAPSAREPGSLLSAIAPPNSFIARTVVSAGDSVAWADITAIPAGLSLPHAAIVDSSLSEWSGTLRVTRSDGSAVTTLIGYPMMKPTALPPMVSVPDASAVKLEIWVEDVDNSTVSHASVGLTPCGRTDRALFISPTLEPVALTPWGNGDYPRAVASSAVSGRRHQGAIVSAAADAPVLPLGAVTLAAPVVALHPSVKSQSSWDFSRVRLYAFSPEGIFAVGLSSDRTRLNASMIDPRGVNAGCLTAFTSRGVVGLTPEGQLLAVAASRATALLSGVEATAIGWNAVTDSLWALRPDGSITDISLSSLSWSRLVTTQNMRSLRCDGRRPLLTSNSATYVPAIAPAADTDISWSCRLPVADRRARVLALRLVMAASSFTGNVTLTADCGDPAQSATLLRLDIDGEINAPVTARVMAPPFPFFTVGIRGRVSSDFRLNSASIYNINV